MGNYQYKDQYRKNSIVTPCKQSNERDDLWRNCSQTSLTMNQSVYDGRNWNNLKCSGLHMDKIREEGNEICYWEPQE